MDKHEAKLILQSYRPNGRDASDPAFAEALAMAQADPELKEWFENEQSMDRAISEKLHNTPVPVDLKKTILSGMRTEQNIVRPQVVWWKSPALAWAAVIVVVFAAAFLIQDQRSNSTQAALADYRTTMRQNLDTLSGFDYPTSSPAKIQSWLDEQGIFGDIEIPENLIGKKSMGCKLFDYKDAQSALICFQLPNMQMVHLFVIEKSAIQELDASSTGVFAKCGEWDTCSWEEDDKLFLLLGKVGNSTLERLASH